MLEYSEVSIYANITAKVSDCWFDSKELSRKALQNFTEVPITNLRNRLIPIPKESYNQNYPIMLLVSNTLSPSIIIDSSYSASGTTTVQLFESGFALLQLKIDISKPIDVRTANSIINSFITKPNIKLANMQYNYIQFAKYILNQVKKEIFGSYEDSTVLSETYSIIQPKGFVQKVDSENLLGSSLEVDIYEAAVRRIPNMAEASLEITRVQQKNLSFYKNDLVYLNYHNLLVYVEPEKEHLMADLYIELTNQFKLYIANLSFMQSEITKNLESLHDIPTSLDELSKESDWLDLYRFKFLKAEEEFESAIDIAAARVSWFNITAYDKFGINEKEERIKRDLNLIEQIISRKLSLLQEEQLQYLGTLMAIVSVILAGIDIIVGIFM